jgi:hypothetical protein
VLQGHQRFRERGVTIGIAIGKANVDAEIAALRPSEGIEPLPNGGDPRLFRRCDLFD